MFVDTHAHLYVDQFNEDIDEVILRAKNLNVKKIFLPNIDSKSIDSLHKLSDSYPNICYPMIGLHPCSVKDDFQKELDIVKENLKNRKYFGIGETGIDLYWDKTFEKEQRESFEIQIELALEYALPIIIHSREALNITIEIIGKYQNGNLKGIFHCFNGTVEQCKEIVDLNFMMGLGGVITYKNAKLDEMISFLPESNMLLETDSPYLSPVPHRGKRNESAYIPLVASKIAEVKNTNVKTIMEISTENALRLFDVEKN